MKSNFSFLEKKWPELADLAINSRGKLIFRSKHNYDQIKNVY